MHDLKKSCDILGVESANTGVIFQTKKGQFDLVSFKA